MIFSANAFYRIWLILGMCFLLCSSFYARSMKGRSKISNRQIWNGYLIDLVCAWERANETDLGQKHTLKCLEMSICERSGFGILLEDNRVLKFDQQGNSKIRKLLQGIEEHTKLK